MPVLKDRLHNISETKIKAQEKASHEAFTPTQTESDIVQKITRNVANIYRDRIAKEGFTDALRSSIKDTIRLEAEKENLDYETQARVEQVATVNIIGLGPIELYMNDATVTEIVVLRWNHICVERNGIIEQTEATFTNEEHLRNTINRIVQPVGRQINLSTPMVDARLPNGSRVNATIPPVTPDGATLTIRKFSEKVMNGADYIKIGSLNATMLKFLAKCVEGKISLIVSGGTSTGKTTLLNMLAQFIPSNELIITIEDSCELRLGQPNVRRMETRVTTNEDMMKVNTQSLVRNALRMRPDRIIVGEIRDGTVVDMMSAMSTGHEGSMSTVHANNPTNLMNSRLPLLYSMNDGVNFTEESQNIQIAEALQLVVHISRLTDGSRIITHISHIYGLNKDGRVNIKDIFVYNKDTKKHTATGYVPKEIIRHAKAHNVIIQESLFKEGE